MMFFFKAKVSVIKEYSCITSHTHTYIPVDRQWTLLESTGMWNGPSAKLISTSLSQSGTKGSLLTELNIIYQLFSYPIVHVGATPSFVTHPVTTGRVSAAVALLGGMCPACDE